MRQPPIPPPFPPFGAKAHRHEARLEGRELKAPPSDDEGGMGVGVWGGGYG
jgi:hypothetical protein